MDYLYGKMQENASYLSKNQAKAHEILLSSPSCRISRQGEIKDQGQRRKLKKTIVCPMVENLTHDHLE